MQNSLVVSMMILPRLQETQEVDNSTMTTTRMVDLVTGTKRCFIDKIIRLEVPCFGDT
jgi:hypothetical protein